MYSTLIPLAEGSSEEEVVPLSPCIDRWARWRGNPLQSPLSSQEPCTCVCVCVCMCVCVRGVGVCVREWRRKFSNFFWGQSISYHIIMPRCACASEVYGSVFVC